MDKSLIKQHSDYLCTLFQGAPIAKSFGMKIHYDEDHRAIFTLPYNKGFDHALGGIHGGVFATMLDNAGWFTAAVHYETWIATVELTTRLLEPVRGQDLIAIGKPVRTSKRLAVTEMDIRTGAGKLVATGGATFAVTSEPLFDR